MKLKEIVLAGAMLLSSAAFSQNKLHFDIHSKGGGLIGIILNTGSLDVNSDAINVSFLSGHYSMDFRKINDSTYREIVENNFLWKSKKEIFEYSFKDSCYKLNSYFVIGEKPRDEKKALEGTVFDEKYEIPPEILNDLKKGLLEKKDSIHFIIQGVSYSIKIENTKKDNNIIYSCDPGEIVKEEPGDFILFPYPIEVRAEKKDGKTIPLKFSTKFLNARTGKNTSIEGELRK
jgi:hypothetical protein